MALRDPHPNPRQDNTSAITGEGGEPAYQDTDNKIVTRSGAGPSDCDFDIVDHDLNGDDWQISQEEGDSFDGEYPHIGGTEVIGLFIESEDDNPFSVEVVFNDENGKTLAKIDKVVDADLTSSSPNNGNHYVYATVAVAGDIFDLVIKDESSANQNIINGTINAH